MGMSTQPPVHARGASCQVGLGTFNGHDQVGIRLTSRQEAEAAHRWWWRRKFRVIGLHLALLRSVRAVV
jgi:hypothetical protein